MKTFALQGTARTIAERSSEQKRALKQLRKNNEVPCVLYGVEKDEKGAPKAIAFKVTAEAVRKLIYTPEIFGVELTIDGKKVNAIVKDMQFHPVKETVLHMDFYQVVEDQPIIMEVPVAMEGLAEGVKSGGKLALQSRKLKVKALYKDIPEKLVVDVTKLGLGKTINVSDLHFEGLELTNAKEAVVCAVKLTRAARGAAAVAEA
ncbi:MAG: 50S ribosomal protein L25/general stress protein Ctc [Bacteroidaceae bacterium]